MRRIIWSGNDYVEFSERQWEQWGKAFYVVISDPGTVMKGRKRHENNDKSNCGTDGVLGAGRSNGTAFVLGVGKT